VNYTLEKISELFEVEYKGDKNYSIENVSSIENANENSIVFLSEKKFLKSLDKSKARVVITTKNLSKFCKNNILITDNPYLLFAKISQIFNKNLKNEYEVHDSVITYTNSLSEKLHIEPNVVIGKNVILGDDGYVGANSYIGNNVKIGKNATIYANVTIYKDVEIGDNIIVHSGTVIGSDGFGYALEKNNWVKIPQVGSVRIGNNVEIGSNTSIDRGTLDNTLIGDGVKIDNQVQIAHNVKIGNNTAIAGCVGIAGSAKIGKNCMIGGGAGIQGHIEICDNTQITGMTKVSSNIKEAGIYTSGTPLMHNKKWLRNAVRFKNLNELFVKFKEKNKSK